MVRQQIELPCIRDKDLRKILETRNIASNIDNNELLCESCSEIITWDNIGAILVKEGKLVVCCDLIDCLENLSKNAQ